MGGSCWKRQGPGGYLARGCCNRHRTVWTAVPLLCGSTQGATQPPPLPPFLHPRLGTKDFKFWLRCSSRGRQTSTAGKPGPPGHLCGANIRAQAHILLNHSAADRLPLWGGGGVSAWMGLSRWKPRWSDLSLGMGYLSFHIWGRDRNGILTDPETWQTRTHVRLPWS